MQPKISSFFKPSLNEPPQVLKDEDDDLAKWEKKEHIIVNTYKRKAPNSDEVSLNTNKESLGGEPAMSTSERPKLKVMNKKRSYAQLHLDLGQSDFLLHTCPICGFKYAPGDGSDEKNHKSFHKDYTHGIQFKGWRNERLIHMPSVEGGRIILVLDSDPPAHTNKVQEVIKMVEMELGGGWIFHNLCKVYLYIFSHRIAGCAIVQTIKEAFKVIPATIEVKSDLSRRKKTSVNTTTLQFGKTIFCREVMKKCSSVNSPKIDGTIVCEKEAKAAVCGIRAIWVSPSNRRKGIASQLLDAVRRSFCTGIVLEKNQLAFSHPSSDGKVLAATYFGSLTFLTYKADKLP